MQNAGSGLQVPERQTCLPQSDNQEVKRNPEGISNRIRGVVSGFRPPCLSSPIRTIYGFLCLTAFTTHVSMTIAHYFQYGTTTETSSSFDLMEMEYPSLTICNANRFRKSFLTSVLEEDKLSEDAPPLSEDTLIQVLLDMKPEELKSAGHSFESMLINQDGIVNYTLGDWHWLYDFGNCYTIVPNNTVSLFDRRLSHKEITSFTFGFDLDENVRAVDSQAPGLFITTDFLQNIYEFDKVAVAIAPGKKYIFKLTIKTTLLLESPYWPNCKDYKERNKKGSQAFCSYECHVSEVVRKCGCLLWGLPLNNRTAHLLCGRQNIEDGDQCFDKVGDFDVTCMQKCEPDCKLTEYELKVHKIPTQKPCIENETCKNGKSIHAEVDLIWESLLHKITEVKPDTKVISLLSDIGGCLGLWLGASILTMPESLFDLANWVCGKKTDDKEKEKPEEGAQGNEVSV